MQDYVIAAFVEKNRAGQGVGGGAVQRPCRVGVSWWARAGYVRKMRRVVIPEPRAGHLNKLLGCYDPRAMCDPRVTFLTWRVPDQEADRSVQVGPFSMWRFLGQASC